MKRLFASVSLMVLSSTLYSTEVRLSVGAGAMENMPVLALPVFEATDAKKGTDALLAKDLREIVRSDLMLSRRFDVKDEEPGAPKIAGAVWRLKAYAGESVGKLSAQVRLENGGGTAESIFERFYRQEKQWLRALAHRIADDVVKAATGREGIARTRIAFINDQTGHKEVYVMDFDGENAKQLTNDKSLSLLPRFSPDARKLAYTSYKDGNPDLFLINLETGHTSTLSDVQGLNIADGRLAGLVDWEAIEDRTRFVRRQATWESPQEVLTYWADRFRYDLWADQDNYIEVFIEKDALIGVIEGVCNELRVPYLACRGYASAS
jgi:TolB protein